MAFRALYREVRPGSLRYLRGLVAPQDAEDIASETWSQIARDFRGWAATIARHRAMDHLRHTQRRPVEATATDAAIAFIATLPPEQAEAVLPRS